MASGAWRSGVSAVRYRRSLILAVILAAVSVSVPALAQVLDAEQQQKLSAVHVGLKRVGANLQLALDTAGPGTGVPAGSKAKLARVRLDTAAADLPQLRQWLAELPAEQADVQTAAAQMSTLEQSAAALDARLSGQVAPPPAAPASSVAAPAQAPSPPLAPATAPAGVSAPPPPAPPPAAASAPAEVKLGYQQEEALRGARFNLREVEGYAAALSQLVAELRPVADQLGIDHRRITTGLNTVETARRKAGFTQDALAKLPPDGQGVGATATALAAATAQVDAAEAYLQPLNQQLAKLIDPAGYPALQQDIKRLGELTVMYGNPMLLQTDRPQAAAVLTESEAAQQEVSRIVTEYRRLIEQQTEEGKRIGSSGDYFLAKHEAFMAAAHNERQALPQQIRADLAQADGIASEAVAQQKPLLFTGGVPQAMGFAADKLILYRVLDPAAAPALEQEVQAMKARLAERERSLAELIVQQNPLPPDRYTGSDREQVVAVAVDAWKHQQAEFTVLASRIPSMAWARETMWQYSNGTWYYVDRSKLQVQLIVADLENDQRAVIQPVTVWMDHQKGDTLIGTPLHAGDEILQPASYLLRDKIR